MVLFFHSVSLDTTAIILNSQNAFLSKTSVNLYLKLFCRLCTSILTKTSLVPEQCIVVLFFNLDILFSLRILNYWFDIASLSFSFILFTYGPKYSIFLEKHDCVSEDRWSEKVNSQNEDILLVEKQRFENN